MLQLDKPSLRRKILQQRQALSQEEWQIKSNLICDRLQNLPLFQSAKTILAYFSFRQEVDLTSLFFLQKTWAFPRCVEQSLVWHLWQSGDGLKFGKYGIPEPLETAPIIAPSLADLILVPAVACDQKGYRLGYGGGFYDRLLSSCEITLASTFAGNLQQRDSSRRGNHLLRRRFANAESRAQTTPTQCVNIPTIGIVFDFAYLEYLPSDTWDIKLDFICTEINFVNCELIIDN